MKGSLDSNHVRIGPDGRIYLSELSSNSYSSPNDPAYEPEPKPEPEPLIDTSVITVCSCIMAILVLIGALFLATLRCTCLIPYNELALNATNPPNWRYVMDPSATYTYIKEIAYVPGYLQAMYGLGNALPLVLAGFLITAMAGFIMKRRTIVGAGFIGCATVAALWSIEDTFWAVFLAGDLWGLNAVGAGFNSMMLMGVFINYLAAVSFLLVALMAFRKGGSPNHLRLFSLCSITLCLPYSLFAAISWPGNPTHLQYYLPWECALILFVLLCATWIIRQPKEEAEPRE